MTDASTHQSQKMPVVEHPAMSIVVVNWNTREMLRDCLASVRATEYGKACELIVVDNASDDGSADMVATEFPDAVLIRNTDNRGFAAANNQGFLAATGDQVLLLNSDTIVLGDVLQDSAIWLDAHPDVAAMGCRVLNADQTMQPTCAMYPSLLNLVLLTSGLWKLSWPSVLGRGQMKDWQRDTERDVETISGCYLLIRRAVLDQIGPLDEDFFFFGEETDWCRRMRDAGWRLVFAPVGEIIHYGGGSAKKLNHRRDVLLSEATVRLHRKHAGFWGALAAFGIVTAFNASRAVFWSLAALFKGQDAKDRARHFRGVLGQSKAVWPEQSS